MLTRQTAKFGKSKLDRDLSWIFTNINEFREDGSTIWCKPRAILTASKRSCQLNVSIPNKGQRVNGPIKIENLIPTTDFDPDNKKQPTPTTTIFWTIMISKCVVKWVKKFYGDTSSICEIKKLLNIFLSRWFWGIKIFLNITLISMV